MSVVQTMEGEFRNFRYQIDLFDDAYASAPTDEIDCRIRIAEKTVKQILLQQDVNAALSRDSQASP